jgi:hypothetical protein
VIDKSDPDYTNKKLAQSAKALEKKMGVHLTVNKRSSRGTSSGLDSRTSVKLRSSELNYKDNYQFEKDDRSENKSYDK